MNQKESYKPYFSWALILGNNFLILIFVQQYSTLGIETKVVKRKKYEKYTLFVKKSYLHGNQILGRSPVRSTLFVSEFVFFCCPAITFVKLITLGWIFIFYWKRMLFLLLVCFGLHKNVEKMVSNWSLVNLIERLQALCTRCAREVIFSWLITDLLTLTTRSGAKVTVLSFSFVENSQETFSVFLDITNKGK